MRTGAKRPQWNRGQRSTEAFARFERGRTIGQCAKDMGVRYATARIWWLLWRIACLEERLEFLNDPDVKAAMGRLDNSDAAGIDHRTIYGFDAKRDLVVIGVAARGTK